MQLNHEKCSEMCQRHRAKLIRARVILCLRTIVCGLIISKWKTESSLDTSTMLLTIPPNSYKLYMIRYPRFRNRFSPQPTQLEARVYNLDWPLQSRTLIATLSFSTRLANTKANKNIYHQLNDICPRFEKPSTTVFLLNIIPPQKGKNFATNNLGFKKEVNNKISPQCSAESWQVRSRQCELNVCCMGRLFQLLASYSRSGMLWKARKT